MAGEAARITKVTLSVASPNVSRAPNARERAHSHEVRNTRIYGQSGICDRARRALMNSCWQCFATTHTHTAAVIIIIRFRIFPFYHAHSALLFFVVKFPSNEDLKHVMKLNAQKLIINGIMKRTRCVGIMVVVGWFVFGRLIHSTLADGRIACCSTLYKFVSVSGGRFANARAPYE